MRGTLLVIAATAGAVGGAALMNSLNRVEPRVPTLTAEPVATVATGGATPAPNRPPGNGATTTAARAELYRVAAAADARELAALIRSAAAEEPSAARTFALEVLLARYAEIDPAAAAAAAADFPAQLRAPLYAAWAMQDAAAALSALAEIADPAAARTIAAALIPALGGDERALRQVAAAVPFGVEASVYAEAIAARAATSPAAALTQALALTDSAARAFALDSIAQSWAALDPRAALAAADDIQDPALRQPFLANIGRTWARLDPDGALSYLTTLDQTARPDWFMTVAQPLVQLRPREILALDNSPVTPAGAPLRMMAIQALASQDPTLALREAETLPAGGQRESAIATIARSYGARDPEAALAWARSSGDPGRLAGVLQGIAQRDPERAFDLAAALDTPLQRTQAIQAVVMGGGFGMGGNTAVLADRLLAVGDAELRSNTLRQLLSTWSAMAPDAAIDWLVTHQVPEAQGAYAQIGQRLARSNAAHAVEQTARIPTTARAEWLQGVAEGYAQSDPRAAAEWLAQYRGDPAYTAAVGAVAAGLATIDPPAAAQLLSSDNNHSTAMRAAYAVAANWAQRDPFAAAAWALDYDAHVDQSLAVPGVTAVWARTDATAARAWTLRLPAGSVRDAALGALLSATVAETIDTAVLDAFSTPGLRNQALINTAMQLSNRDRAAAVRFLDTYVTDDALREQAKRNLERIRPGMMFEQRGISQGLRPIF